MFQTCKGIITNAGGESVRHRKHLDGYIIKPKVTIFTFFQQEARLVHFTGLVVSNNSAECLAFNKTDDSLTGVDCSEHHGVACFSACLGEIFSSFVILSYFPMSFFFV